MEKLGFASFPGKIHVIDSVGAEFNRAIAYLRAQKVIGFDTETRPTFSQDQPRYGVALLQLSGPDKAFLFRINKMGMHRRLCNLMASDKIVKVVENTKEIASRTPDTDSSLELKLLIFDIKNLL